MATFPRSKEMRKWRALLASISRIRKRVPIGLTYIHGIGRTKAAKICHKVGIPPIAGACTS